MKDKVRSERKEIAPEGLEKMSSFERLVSEGLARRLKDYNGKARVLNFSSCFIITVFLYDLNYYIEYRIDKKHIEYDWFIEREKLNYITKQTIEDVMEKINKFVEEKKNEKV